MKRLFVVVGLLLAGAFVLTGCAPDDPVITSTSWPAAVHSGTELAIVVLAKDAGQNNYQVEWVPHGNGPQLVDEICTGVAHDRPSADVPSCEYDDNTTTTSTTTTTVALFTWTGAVGSQYTFEFCAASFNSSVKNCVSKVLRIS
jgi:hypothetical protein